MILFTDEKTFATATTKTHRMTDCTNVQQWRRKTSGRNACAHD